MAKPQLFHCCILICVPNIWGGTGRLKVIQQLKTGGCRLSLQLGRGGFDKPFLPYPPVLHGGYFLTRAFLQEITSYILELKPHRQALRLWANSWIVHDLYYLDCYDLWSTWCAKSVLSSEHLTHERIILVKCQMVHSTHIFQIYIKLLILEGGLHEGVLWEAVTRRGWGHTHFRGCHPFIESRLRRW